MTMTMLANPGDKIRYVKREQGRVCDMEYAESLLTDGEVYTLKRVRVGGFSTQVWVEGIDKPGGFNILLFDDVEIDPVLLAARGAYIENNPRAIPMDTDKVSMVDTVYAVQALLKQVMFSDASYDIDYGDDEGYDIGVMLLASASVGPDIEAIVKFTGLPEGEVCDWHYKTVHCGIFTNDGKVNCGWFEEDGMTALLCDILTVQGILSRELVDG